MRPSVAGSGLFCELVPNLIATSVETLVPSVAAPLASSNTAVGQAASRPSPSCKSLQDLCIRSVHLSSPIIGELETAKSSFA